MPAKRPPTETSAAFRLIRPAPIETVVVTDELSGRLGRNRSPGRRQIGADTDHDAVLAWLARSADSPNTLANSRREAERLLLWSLVEAGKPLSSLTHEDLLAYQRFLADPQPAERWVMTGRKLPRQHADWRPFAGPLSTSSARQAMVVINSLFSWLVQAGYLAGNPLALARQRRANTTPRVVRFLEEDLWVQVKATIQVMPGVTSRELASQARARWLFSLLFLCGLRISEVVGNTMGGFFNRPDPKGEPHWWLEITGKGGKTRLVPATRELMVELMHYRRSLGLAALPIEHEATPLLLPVWWHAPSDPRGSTIEVPEALTRAAVHQIVKSMFEQAAHSLESQHPDLAPRAERLRAASAHWLRHTAGSRMADQEVDLRHVRDTFGHASISTTNIYLHAEDTRRHHAIEAAHRLGWD
ncbi:MAG TPA: tyrosine-type recombinase/integrase [Piscinibacter sp.]|nr:MAG: integrase [Burkholderiaceae bacterium]HPM68464.1 tyrosine-type recombinase/integrase [Piscinibacter sp.]